MAQAPRAADVAASHWLGLWPRLPVWLMWPWLWPRLAGDPLPAAWGATSAVTGGPQHSLARATEQLRRPPAAAAEAAPAEEHVLTPCVREKMLKSSLPP